MSPSTDPGGPAADLTEEITGGHGVFLAAVTPGAARTCRTA